MSLGIACFQWNNSHTPEQSSLHTGNSLAHSHETPPSTEYRVSKESYSTDGISRSLSSTHLDVRVFNIWLLCQKAYTIDPSSAKFLLQHGFDFNKQFGKGIPYSPSPMKVKTSNSLRKMLLGKMCMDTEVFVLRNCTAAEALPFLEYPFSFSYMYIHVCTLGDFVHYI